MNIFEMDTSGFPSVYSSSPIGLHRINGVRIPYKKINRTLSLINPLLCMKTN